MRPEMSGGRYELSRRGSLLSPSWVVYDHGAKMTRLVCGGGRGKFRALAAIGYALWMERALNEAEASTKAVS